MKVVIVIFLKSVFIEKTLLWDQNVSLYAYDKMSVANVAFSVDNDVSNVKTFFVASSSVDRSQAFLLPGSSWSGTHLFIDYSVNDNRFTLRTFFYQSWGVGFEPTTSYLLLFIVDLLLVLYSTDLIYIMHLSWSIFFLYLQISFFLSDQHLFINLFPVCKVSYRKDSQRDVV